MNERLEEAKELFGEVLEILDKCPERLPVNQLDDLSRGLESILMCIASTYAGRMPLEAAIRPLLESMSSAVDAMLRTDTANNN